MPGSGGIRGAIARRTRRALSDAYVERLLPRAIRLAGRLGGGHYIGLEYPPTAEERPRFGWGREPHPYLLESLRRGNEGYRDELEQMLAFKDELAAIPRTPGELDPGWIQDPAWILGMDGVSLYGMMRTRRPRRYVEIGSGNSTKFVARAKRDGALDSRLVSIDPYPRAEIDVLCDEVVRRPLESVDLSLFEQLEAGDVVFFDGSHRVFMNSDVTAFFLDVLPRLRPGVTVGIHDILLPWDYPPEWAERHYSEQYMLAALLLSGTGWLVPVLPCYHVHLEPELRTVLDPLWSMPSMDGVDRRGFAFWLRVGERVS